MKTLGAILLFAALAFGQGGNMIVQTGAGAPAGNCVFVRFWINSANGDFYGCRLGSWQLIGPAAGAGTVTDFSAGALSPLFTTSVATSTTTPALSFTLSNAAATTLFGNNTTGATTPAYFAPLTARGDLLLFTGASPIFGRLAKGTQYTVLQAGASEPAYDAVHLDQAAAVTGTLPNTSLAGSGATTVNTQSCALGGSCTVTAAPSGTAGGDLSGTYPNPTLANIPTATPMAGSLLATAIAAPGTPAAGKGSIYVDSTSKNIAVKDDAGVVKHGIQTKAAVSNSFATAIDDAGVVTVAQPSFSNLSGSVAAGQMPALTGAVTSSAGAVATSPGKIDVLDASGFCADAGSNDTYACNLSPAVTAYVTGTHYRFSANTANTGAASINFNGVGACTIKKFTSASPGADLSNNDIRAGQMVEVMYDGTNCQMISAVGNAGGGSGDVTAVGDCASGDCFNALNTGTTLTFSNATSGTVDLKTVTGALGTKTISLPSTDGTVAVAATAPLVLNATTGTLTCSAATATVAGCVPTPPNNTTTFLRGDATFAAPAAANFVMAGQNGFRTISSNTTAYLGVNGFSTETGTEAYRVTILNAAVTATALSVYIDSTEPATCTLTFTLRKCTASHATCADTALTLAIAAGSTAGTYSTTGASIAYASGNGVDIKVNESNCGSSSSQIGGYSITFSSP